VVVAINGSGYRSSITRQKDGWEFIASLAFRSQTGTELGDCVDVDIVLDRDERTISPPADIAERLASSPTLQAWWDAQPYSHQREIVMYVEDAKRPDTRARRIDAIVASSERGADARPHRE